MEPLRKYYKLPWVPEIVLGIGLMTGYLGLAANANAEMALTPSVVFNPDIQEGATRFGMSIGLVGDVTGDGIADIGVGAPFYNDGPDLPGTPTQGTPLNVGKAYIIDSASQTLTYAIRDPLAAITDDGVDVQFAKFGRIRAAGDVNNDGVPDIVTSAYFRDVEGPTAAEHDDIDGAGQAFVHSGVDGSVINILDDPTPQMLGRYGCYVDGLGDVNGDGIPDQVISVPFKDIDGLRDVGESFVHSGADGSVLLQLSNPFPQEGARFGLFTANAGDINGDTFDDIINGAPGQGQAFVHSGADGSLLLTIDHPSPQANSKFARKLIGGKDTNGDGVPDFLIGAHQQNVGNNTDQGQAFLISGADGSLLRIMEHPEPQAFSQFGYAVFMVDDLTGDDLAELLISAPDQDINGMINVGKAFLFNGADGTLLATMDHPDPEPYAGFGFAVTSGDVSGDGVSDLLVSAPFQDWIESQSRDVDVHLDQGMLVLFKTNLSPSADAGVDRIVNENSRVRLDASGSSDPNGDTLNYRWRQLTGPTAPLKRNNTANPMFTAPAVDVDTVLSFRVTVTDGTFQIQDTVEITVQNTNNIVARQSKED